MASRNLLSEKSKGNGITLESRNRADRFPLTKERELEGGNPMKYSKIRESGCRPSFLPPVRFPGNVV